jgi:hypothetical protein
MVKSGSRGRVKSRKLDLHQETAKSLSVRLLDSEESASLSSQVEGIEKIKLVDSLVWERARFL